MNDSNNLSVLVVEDNLATAEWLIDLLEGNFDFKEIKHAATLADAKLMVKRHSFHIALVDIQLPDGSGIDLIRTLRTQQPTALAIVATIYDDDRHIFEALKAGAEGYLLKDGDQDTMIQQLKGAISGQPALSPNVARRVISHFHEQPNQPDLEGLTNREQDVLVLIAKGLTRKEISKHLSISEHTTAGYIKNIYRKLNINSRAEAALEAGRRGLVS